MGCLPQHCLRSTHAGSRYHRPAEHTHTTSGRTLQALQLLAAGSAEGGGGGGSGAGGSGGRGGKLAAPAEPAVELLEDENDDLCHICGLGVRLPSAYMPACLPFLGRPAGTSLPINTCLPACLQSSPCCCLSVDHAGDRCLASRMACPPSCPQGDLICCETCPAVYHAACLGLAAAPEGDYFCPHCRCTACGAGGSGE